MSEAKFSKGPWAVKDGVIVCSCLSDPYSKVAYAYSGHSIPYTNDVLSNAHLIAAAPEMYEMLETLNSMTTYGAKEFLESSNAVTELLAKARGDHE
jgi:hypothetical protein